MSIAKWIHKRCSGVKGSLGKVQGFECSVSKAGITKQDDLDLCIGRDMSFESVEAFCYLGNMPSSDGGCFHAVLVRVDKAWNKFSSDVTISDRVSRIAIWKQAGSSRIEI